MKIFGAIAVILFCLVPFFAQAGCPEGMWSDPKTGICKKCPGNQWYNPDPRVRRCVKPGEDPTGKVDQDYRRRLIEEGQGFCVDSWCCPNEKAYFDCDNLKSKSARNRCLIKKKCFVYGE